MERPIALVADAKSNPLLMSVTVRDSEAAPGRLKVGLTIDSSAGMVVVGSLPGGTLEIIEAAKIELPKGASPIMGICPEFRIEMN